MLKNKTIFSLSLLAAAMALTACQPKNTEPQEDKVTQSQTMAQAEVLKLAGDVEKLTLNLPECKGNNCPEMNIERLSSNQPFIDEFIDQQILKRLDQTLDISAKSLKTNPPAVSAEESAASSPVQADEPAASVAIETPKQQLEKQVTPYVETFLSLDKELKDLGSSHQISLMIKPKILNANQPLATVVLNSSSYLGGAHGSSSQRYYNFDLEKKKIVELQDILAPNQKAALEKKAHEAFKQWVIDSELASNVEEYEQAWKFKLSDNFYLSTQGLILQYGEYEIGPYVVGLPRLTIPYDQLQTVLKTAYLPQAEVENEQAASAARDSKAQS
ncbi:DUF3298 domain-containing protein [Acinetobacter sp. RF15A]|uniref:RsiV family protein n=1 Tax=unclassified Acinetobacter TaxID=196816 RepID=UPI001166C66A|nr:MULTISPECIES: RsiV family protein [unclassified Acinetobacter]TQR65287.1 DUF3298 domain-containing protein [Acinetobacter sp. RF14B]TSH69912.1 DUF3298 domain-containing protein [Acinetobacter sp. RF15A]TSI17214.1 DUF3298 domain-containing protein [Acinetobacter sp. RF15B]